MIKNITPGTGITINDGHMSWPSFYNSPSSNSLVGQMRYNGSNQNIEVYDGNSWLMMSSTYPTIELSPHVQAAVTWAQIKMAEESRLRELAAKHPAVADALQAVAQAEEQVRIVAALVDTA
jgi:ribosomal protein S10